MDVEVLLPRQSACSLMSFRLRSSSVEDLNRRASSLPLKLGGKVPYPTQEQLKDLILELHNIDKKAVKDFVISYTDHNSDELPLSNDDTVLKALDNSNKLLRINLQKRAESLEEQYGYGIDIEKVRKDRSLPISGPHDFRKVSSIMDADLLPMELRRVQLCKYGTNQPLGLYIRNGPSVRLTLNGPVIKEGIFISRLVEGALAASTNLIHPNDEIVEVNGINVGFNLIILVFFQFFFNLKISNKFKMSI
ncbi:hypothetical protein WR25_03916 isoform B [Diploscapter pachys]|uniref:PDZ domain-containing protein n=1 Tax=Diploscapter pachys TaxID=2018661 RepID=A0A2A2KK46_9BILA|nr:hypothetical protein WR25_03916 isoform B [Diploscapter pachys]